MAFPLPAGAGPRWIIAAIPVIVGLSILLVWITVRVAAVEYSVQNAQIKIYNLSSSNALNARFDLSLHADNRNRWVSIYYDSVEVTVWYEDQMVAFADGSPFFQPKRNLTVLDVMPEARSVPLMGAVAGKLRKDRSGGEVELEVRVEARVRFKVGVFKSKHYAMSVSCSPVVVDFSASKKFDRVYCDVD